MFKRKSLQRAIGFLVCSIVCHQSHAVLNCGGPTIDARKDPYDKLEAVVRQDVGAYSEYYLRVNVMVAAAGKYRSHERKPLGAGSSFKMIYKDGTRECGVVVTPSSSAGTQPIDGTQSDGTSFNVEGSRWFIRQFSTTGFHGTYQICYDYYSNGEWTATQCTVKVW